MKAEERRALVLLGLLAVMVGLWDKLPPDSFINFPANSPVPHLTINDIPLLAVLIELWVGYGICMFVYFSDDWFVGKRWWIELRTFCHGIGLMLIGLVLVIGYFSAVAALSFFLPDYVQGPYWLVAGFGELVLLERIAVGAFRTQGVLRRGTVIWFRSLAELAREAKSGILEAIEAFKEWRKRRKGSRQKKACN